MGYTTHLYKCDNCNKEFLYTSKQAHPITWHRCQLKPIKQMDKKSFEHLAYILDPKSNIDEETRHHQYEYWKNRINLRIQYIQPVINECMNKGYDIATISKELHDEWIELHEVKRFYKF